MRWLFRGLVSIVREYVLTILQWLLAIGAFVAIVGGLGHPNRAIHWSTATVFLVGPLVVCVLLLRHGLRKRDRSVDSGPAATLTRGGATLMGLVFLAYYAVAIWMALKL
jgi:hypothetical protein